MIKKAAIVGVGLIGGSFGLALRKFNLAREVIGMDVDSSNLREAVKIGAVHRAIDDPAQLPGDVEVVILAIPVGKTVEVLKELIPCLSAGAVITDVGSVKESIVRSAEGLIPPSIYFVGGHPMAGSELAGIRGADAYLFENAYYLLTPTGCTKPQALQKVKELVRGVGAQPVEISPEEHDMIVAAVSHLPHLVACALVNVINDISGQERILPFAAGGFQDTTRIASGNPSLWKDILLNNKKKVLEILKHFREALQRCEGAMASGNGEAILRELETAARTRKGIPARSKGYLPALYEIVVTIPDRPGSIAEISGYLAGEEINISDIEILRAREGEGGTVRIAFSKEEEQEAAVRILSSRGIPARKR